MVEGRDAAPACAWLAQRPPGWLAQIAYGTLDLAGTYRKVYDTMLPDAVQVADPFHVVKLANACVDGSGACCPRAVTPPYPKIQYFSRNLSHHA